MENIKKSEEYPGVKSLQLLGQDAALLLETPKGMQLSEKEVMIVATCLLTKMVYNMNGDAFVIAFHGAKAELKKMGIDNEKVELFMGEILENGKKIRKQNPFAANGFAP